MRATFKPDTPIKIISEPYSKLYSGKTRRFVKGKCCCGNEMEMLYSPISNDYPKTCGCGKLVFKDKEKTAKMRSSYASMKARCYNSKNDNYKWYGGIGITVCDRWMAGFEYFYEDMEATWFLGAQIDRYPNTKGKYEKSNCRWATPTQQQRNKLCVKVTETDVLFIRESKLLQRELAEMFGVKNGTISRIKNNKRWNLN